MISAGLYPAQPLTGYIFRRQLLCLRCADLRFATAHRHGEPQPAVRAHLGDVRCSDCGVEYRAADLAKLPRRPKKKGRLKKTVRSLATAAGVVLSFPAVPAAPAPPPMPAIDRLLDFGAKPARRRPDNYALRVARVLAALPRGNCKRQSVNETVLNVYALKWNERKGEGYEPYSERELGLIRLQKAAMDRELEAFRARKFEAARER